MQLPVELFLALRYLRPRRTFVSIITVLSFLGVLIGVGVLIVVLSVMAGFQETITDNIIGFNAHITVAMADDSPTARMKLDRPKRIKDIAGAIDAAAKELGDTPT